MQDALVPRTGAIVAEASGAVRRPEILCLTSLRFFAALEVVFFHTLFELGGKPVQALPRVLVALLTRGGAAVSFFFVLSGFILAYTYSDESGMKGTPRKFWRARFARIYPLYFLGFLIDAPRVVSFFVASTASLKAAAVKIGVAGMAYLTLLQSWHPRVTNTWNTPGWSLSTEAFFYAVFPALYLATRRWSLTVVFAVIASAWAAQLAAYGLLTHFRLVDGDAASFLTFWRSFPPLRLPEFALGVATGRLMLRGWVVGRESRVRWAGIAATVLIVLLSASSGLMPEALEVSLLAPLFAVVILALGSGAVPTFDWLNGSLLVLLGRASYAVYVLHQPLKTVFLTVARWAALDAPSPALLVAYLLFVQLTCVALFLYFEDPLRRLLTRRSR